MSARDPIDTSSISFTALYTGHCWVANGLSAEPFRTRMGAFYYHSLAPFEALGKKLVGGNIRTFLVQRHLLIDHLVRQAVENEGVTQVLEIACGLTPRGYRFMREYPELDYLEADLPDMAARKQRLLETLPETEPRPRVLPINVFATEGELSPDHVFGQLDRSKPVLVITEGLVNYFDTDTISGFWKRLSALLEGFPKGIYLTDNYPMYHDHPFYRTMTVLRRMLGSVSRSSVSFHFGSDEEAREHMQAMGFNRVRIHNPRDYYDTLSMPRSRGNPFVRIIESRVE